MGKYSKLIFHVGGPDFHPAAEQARLICNWLGEDPQGKLFDGLEAFEHLDGCELLVLMGTHWTGMHACNLEYHPMQRWHQDAFDRYVRSGRPLMVHHGAICSYDDWQGWADRIGVKWHWGVTNHSPIGMHPVRVEETGHPVVTGVRDYSLFDEIYYHIKISDGFDPQIHAYAPWDGADHPMVMTAKGGRTEGAGKMVYLANGHDMRAMECEAMKSLWINSIQWLLQ